MHKFLQHSVAGLDAEFEGGLVGDPCAIATGDGDASFLRKLHQLRSATVHQNHPDAQRAEHGQVQQQVAKVGRSRHLAVEGDNKDFFPETRDILENAS